MASFVFCNKMILRHYSSWRVEELKVQLEKLQEEFNKIKEEAMNSYRENRFRLSEVSRTDYSALQAKDWEVLFNPKLDEIISAKDATILKLYFTFMGKKELAAKQEGFIKSCQQFFKDNKASIEKAMEPERTFDFSEATVKKIVELLLVLKSQATDIKGASNFLLFDTLASTVVDALKFAQLVPSMHNSQLEEITRKINRRKRMKCQLEKYLHYE
eukprot:TRINITY_DN8880_c0_g1_i6.p1 TRINITY_DN8880_c0_g1~~TRINITY_DN8880_c0_g1_i6.p1  ORF type:complete len:215 (+),score=47.19 TRINITY_DN8880_c0_g1_i6:223-867(+)